MTSPEITLTPKEKRLEERKRLILRKSRDLFLRRGYENVSIREICEAVGYGKSAIYAHFTGKEEIYAHIKLEGLRILADLLADIKPAAKHIRREFVRCAKLFCDFYRNHGRHYRALFLVRRGDFSSDNPELQASIEAETTRAATPLLLLLEHAATEKEIQVPSGPQDLAYIVRLYSTSMVGIINSFILHGEEDDPRAVEDACVAHANIYFTGLVHKD